MTRTWDAKTYDRVAAPHVAWSDAILDRLELRGDETVLDAGCGSGHVTELLLDRVPDGRVIAVDGDEAMVAHARERLGDRAEVLHQDLLALELPEPVDAVFSSAVFHWIADHATLYRRLAAVLRPGGRLSAQCGGAGNIARVKGIADRLAAGRDLQVQRIWNYAEPEDDARLLRAAGFADVRAWLQPWPVVPPEPLAYLESVCLGPYVQGLPAQERTPFARAVLDELGEPPELDYVRLNLVALRP